MVAFMGAVGAVHAIGVFDVFIVEAKDDHSKDVADAEFIGKGNFAKGFRRALVKQNEGALASVAGEDGEVDPARHKAGSKGKRPSGSQPKIAVAVGGVDVNPGLHGLLVCCLRRDVQGGHALGHGVVGFKEIEEAGDGHGIPNFFWQAHQNDAAGIVGNLAVEQEEDT